MGGAGSLHCLAMCGASSTGLVSACCGGSLADRWTSFHAGRIAGYALAGAMAASSVSALSRLGELTPMLKPLWTMAHIAAMALGVWLMITGRQPTWFDRPGRQAATNTVTGDAAIRPVSIHTKARGIGTAAMTGTAWVLWPCGLLQSALMVAALANGPINGALVMIAFASTSAVGLGGLPYLMRKRASSNSGGLTRWIIRLSGVVLAGASAWALGHGLWVKVAAYCFG